jgi:hypothetical protein
VECGCVSGTSAVQLLAPLQVALLAPSELGSLLEMVLVETVKVVGRIHQTQWEWVLDVRGFVRSSPP